ncbi:MAG: universal stress protein [Bdellovibrio sp.]
MKIIWAVDAFEDNKELNQKMAHYLSHLHSKTQAEIEPLYLLRENEIILPTYEVPTWVSDHSRTAESLFKEVLSDYGLSFLQTPRVIPHASQSHAGAAETLSHYALKAGADLILVGSHGRQGFQRFILGSFAESLLLQSEVPVCVIGHHITQSSSAKHILFPTEFGEHSRQSFRHILKWAQAVGAEITLLHAISRPVESLFDLETRPRVYNYRGKMMSLDEIIEHEVETKGHHAELWTHWAKNEGVSAQFLVDNSFRAIDELILDAAEKNDIDLIVMEAQSGPLSAALLGSYTRNVVRKAACPVYVLPRHFYDKTKEEDAPHQAPPPF